MEYQRAQILRGRSLRNLITDRTLAGQGFGKSISSSIRDKTKAKLTGIKEKFDPMNISRAIGGRLGAYAYGKLAGRSEEDMAYFTGARRRSSVLSEALGITPVKNDPLISKVSDGENRPVRKGEGISNIMARIFNLLKRRILEEREENQIAKNFEEEQESEKQRRHEELLDALKNLGGGTASEEKKGKSFLERIIEIVKKMLAKIFEKIKPLLKFVKILMKTLAQGKALSTLKQAASLLMRFPGTALLAGAFAAVDKIIDDVDERQSTVRVDPYKPEYLSDPYAMIQRGEASNNAEAGSLNAQKIGKQKTRDLVQSIITNPDFTEADKKKELSVQNLQQVTNWLTKTEGNQRAKFQGEVTNRDGKLIVLSGGTDENLVVPKTNPRSPKYVAPAPVTPVARIIDVEGAGSGIISAAGMTLEGYPINREDVAEANSVPATAPVPVTASRPVPRPVPNVPAPAAAATSAVITAAATSAVKVEEPAEKPAAATAVPANKPYKELGNGLRVDANLSEEEMDPIKRNPQYYKGLEDDEMWGMEDGRLNMIKIPKSVKSNKSNRTDKEKEEEIRKQTEDQRKRSSNMMDQTSMVPTGNLLNNKFLEATKYNNDLNLADNNTTAKPTIIDASKSVATSGGGGDSGIISSARVRTDDPTLLAILKGNRRFDGPFVYMA